MEKLTLEQFINFFENVKGRVPIPFKINQMAHLVEELATKKDIESLNRLATVMETAYQSANLDKKRMIITARETLLTLGYIADNPPSREEWIEVGPVRAYRNKKYYGPAMRLLKKIYVSKGLDIFKDCFPGDSSLN